MNLLLLGGSPERRRLFTEAFGRAMARPDGDPLIRASRRPDAIVWLGGGPASELSKLLAALARLDGGSDETPVFSIVDVPDDAGALPPELSRFNAIILSTLAVAPADRWLGAADIVLSAAWRGTRRRRIFLSYYRKEGTTVAMQLKHELELRGFDVFLDTTEVPHGRDFRRSLRASLVDTDLVVVLLSPGLGTRPWCTYEISYANAAHIGLLALVWPGATRVPETERIADRLLPDQQIALTPASFVDGDVNRELTADVLQHQLVRMYQVRYRKLRARLEVVEATFKEQHGGDGEWTTHDVGLLGRRKSGRIERVRVLPFRPGLDLLHADYRQLRRGADRLTWSWHEAADPGDATRAFFWLTRGFRGRRDGAKLRTWPIMIREGDGGGES